MSWYTVVWRSGEHIELRLYKRCRYYFLNNVLLRLRDSQSQQDTGHTFLLMSWYTVVSRSGEHIDLRLYKQCRYYFLSTAKP